MRREESARPRSACDDLAPDGHRSREVDVPLQRAGFQADGCAWKSGEGHPRVTARVYSFAMNSRLKLFTLSLVTAAACAADFAPPERAFIQKNCFECHDADTRKGDLDLTALKFDPSDLRLFAEWVKVHDRVHDCEMP